MISVSHRLRHLNIWLWVGGPVLGGLGGPALLEEAHHWEWALRLYSFTLSIVFSLCFLIVFADVSSQLTAQGFKAAADHYESLPWWALIFLEPQTKINSFSDNLPWSSHLITEMKKKNTVNIRVKGPLSAVLLDSQISLEPLRYGKSEEWQLSRCASLMSGPLIPRKAQKNLMDGQSPSSQFSIYMQPPKVAKEASDNADMGLGISAL